MRILFLDQFSDFGGGQLCLRDVLLEVRRRGWDATVMAPGCGPLLDFARDLGFDAGTLPMAKYSNGRKSASDALRYGFDLLRSVRRVGKVLRERPANLVYVNGPRVMPLAEPRGPVLFHAHSVVPGKLARTGVDWLLRRTRAEILACSEFAAGPLPARARVIYSGVADQGFAPRRAREGPLRVGILGRIAPEKGHLDFLRAAQAFPEPEGVRFVVIGAALFSDPAYERSIRGQGGSCGVEFLGWTGDVSAALHNLDILAVPSAALEASPRVVMEALSAGTCVAAYRSGGIPELIRDGYSGLLVKECSPDGLARAIRTLARDPDLRARLAQNGRREWEARFTVGRFQRDVCDRIAGLTGAPEPSSSEVRCA